MQVTLPESLEPFIQERLSVGGYESVSQYIQELIEADLNRERIESLLIEGIESGPPIEVNEEFWAEMRQTVVDRGKGR